MKSIHLIYVWMIPALTAGIFFSSCENSVKEVSMVTQVDHSADETMDTVHMVMTDMGKVTFTLRAPRIEKFYDDEPKTFFPDGVMVEFYDSLHQKEAVLTSNEGVIYDGQNRIELHHEVVFRNLQKHQTLYTEELIWEQRADSSIVYSNKPVHVDDQGSHYYGKEGIIADETFSWYEIKSFSADLIVPDTTTKNGQ